MGKKVWIPKRKALVDNEGFQMVGKPRSIADPGPGVILVHNSFDALLGRG